MPLPWPAAAPENQPAVVRQLEHVNVEFRNATDPPPQEHRGSDVPVSVEGERDMSKSAALSRASLAGGAPASRLTLSMSASYAMPARYPARSAPPRLTSADLDGRINSLSGNIVSLGGVELTLVRGAGRRARGSRLAPCGLLPGQVRCGST